MREPQRELHTTKLGDGGKRRVQRRRRRRRWRKNRLLQPRNWAAIRRSVVDVDPVMAKKLDAVSELDAGKTQPGEPVAQESQNAESPQGRMVHFLVLRLNPGHWGLRKWTPGGGRGKCWCRNQSEVTNVAAVAANEIICCQDK